MRALTRHLCCSPPPPVRTVPLVFFSAGSLHFVVPATLRWRLAVLAAGVLIASGVALAVSMRKFDDMSTMVWHYETVFVAPFGMGFVASGISCSALHRAKIDCHR